MYNLLKKVRLNVCGGIMKVSTLGFEKKIGITKISVFALF